MRNFITLLLAVIVVGCSSDSSSSKNTNIPQSYVGNWTGNYTGDSDHGTFDIDVSSTGDVTGTTTSTVYSHTYTITGKVQSNGSIASTFGTASSGGTFNGILQTNSNASGTWTNNIPDPDINGTWSGEKVN